MDKREERRAFDAIFGSFGLTVEEGEQPDFVCSQNDKTLFGVEITEFFWTESDARLQKIESYASDLIGGGRYRHKDDINEIVVEDVVYHVAATGQRFPIKAIGRMIPPHQVSAPKLLAVIASKNGKVSEYQKRVSPVDLIVADVDMIFRFDTIQQILEPIVAGTDSATVFASPFREIYLITQCNQKGVVAIPLRANLFASEIALFTDVFKSYRKNLGGRISVGEYLNALAAYLVTRLPGVMYFKEAGRPHFVFGSIAWRMTPDQNVNVTDISSGDPTGWAPLAPEVDASSLPSRLLEMVGDRRKEAFFGYELFF